MYEIIYYFPMKYMQRNAPVQFPSDSALEAMMYSVEHQRVWEGGYFVNIA